MTGRADLKAPLLAVTAGDPAGVGPEVLLKAIRSLADRSAPAGVVYVVERVALEAVRDVVPAAVWQRLAFCHDSEELAAAEPGAVPVIDPVGEPRELVPGRSGAADAVAALRAIDRALELVESGQAGALVTGPVSKASIANHVRPDFRGHTEYLAGCAGLATYGRDYLMTFVTPDQQIALLSTHLPLVDAVTMIDQRRVVEALSCLHRHAGGRIAVAGLNPHAGEGGLLGGEEEAILVPAIEQARGLGIDVVGPESPDSVFSRLRAGAFDWVLALYHDQGLIPIKTVSFGESTNWTLGLPFLRTSVDHGTAFDIAGRGLADEGPLLSVLDTTGRLARGELPRRRPASLNEE